MLKCILLGILASAPAWAFSAPGGLGARGWRGTRLVAYNVLFNPGLYVHVFVCSAGECAASLSVQHKNLVHVATRPRWHTAVLSLSATQNLAVDPEAAWAQYSSSGGFILHVLILGCIGTWPRHMADFYMIGSHITFQFLTWRCVHMGSCCILTDGRLLSAICPTLRVLEPATGREVTVGEVVGNGKGLVVFMRHVG